MPSTDWECSKCTYVNVSQAKVCMICQNKYTPKACKHDGQHQTPMNEEWVMRCETPSEMQVCLVCYALVSNEGGAREAHAEETGHCLFMAMDTGALYCTACGDSIEDADGTFWYVNSIRHQRLNDDADRAEAGSMLNVIPEGKGEGKGKGKAKGKGSSDGEAGAASTPEAGKDGDNKSAGDAGAGEEGADGDGAGGDGGAGEVGASIFESGWTDLHDAAKAGHLDLATELVATHPEYMHGIHQADGWTPLFYAAYSGHTEIVKVLIDAGSDVHYQCARFGWSPLHAAATSGAAEAAELLINAGSRLDALNNEGVNPVDLCIDDDMAAGLRAIAASLADS